MSYVRNAWYVAGWSHELAKEIPLALSILGERIVVWRSASGTLNALEDRCIHRLAPLSLGRCEGKACGACIMDCFSIVKAGSWKFQDKNQSRPKRMSGAIP
ncbi:Rieske 2Fe-2S domain-containing protein [Novosphingobium sp. THN1]|uniref:Rieske 2Fe-2S domain-containing protein n=1 Tax=Novosphingobium sp. THN1 TaxID=1016987 RepID=UPI001F082120|nr:Rieske 2Fe-2S domain-containing protein [Novosphingobium sp. THN1]